MILCKPVSEIGFKIKDQQSVSIWWFYWIFNFILILLLVLVPLDCVWIMTPIATCTFTYHRAWEMVMMAATYLCAASLSLCYTATSYGVDESIGSCRCIGDSRYRDSILHIPQVQWRWCLLVCCFFEECSIMASQDMQTRVLACWWQSHNLHWFAPFPCV